MISHEIVCACNGLPFACISVLCVGPCAPVPPATRTCTWPALFRLDGSGSSTSKTQSSAKPRSTATVTDGDDVAPGLGLELESAPVSMPVLCVSPAWEDITALESEPTPTPATQNGNEERAMDIPDQVDQRYFARSMAEFGRIMAGKAD